MSGIGDGWPSKWLLQLIFSASVLVYLISATVSSLWWAASLTKEMSNMSERLANIEHRFDGLDNVSLGNRVTALEVARLADVEQRNRMERKIDRLLERRYTGTRSGPAQATGQE